MKYKDFNSDIEGTLKFITENKSSIVKINYDYLRSNNSIEIKIIIKNNLNGE